MVFHAGPILPLSYWGVFKKNDPGILQDPALRITISEWKHLSDEYWIVATL